MLAGIRILLGVLFVISGGEKIISPVENFLMVIHGYDFLPQPLERLAAMVFPWVELFTGLFLLAGLWLRQALMVLIMMSVSLMLVVGQAILRRLPMENCGCFGELIHLPLQGVFFVDLTVLALSVFCLVNYKKAMRFSVDAMYAQK